MGLKNKVPKSRTQRSTKLSHASIALYSITYCIWRFNKCQEENWRQKLILKWQIRLQIRYMNMPIFLDILR